MESENTEKLSSSFELPSQLQRMSFESKTDDISVSIRKHHSALAAEVNALKIEKLPPASPPDSKNPNVHAEHSEQELKYTIDIPGIKNIPIKKLHTARPKRSAPASLKASPDTPRKRSPHKQNISGGQESSFVAGYAIKLRSTSKKKNLIKSFAERTTQKKRSSDKRSSSKNEISETNESVFTELRPESELSTTRKLRSSKQNICSRLRRTGTSVPKCTQQAIVTPKRTGLVSELKSLSQLRDTPKKTDLHEGDSQSSTIVSLMTNFDTHSSTTPRRKPQSTKRKLTATNQIKSPMYSETSMKVTRSTFRRVTRSKAAALGKTSKIVYELKVSAKKTGSRRADLGSLKQKLKTEILRYQTEEIEDKPSTDRTSASILSQNAVNVPEEKKHDDSDIMASMASSSIINVSYVPDIQNAIVPKDKSPNIVDASSHIYHVKDYNTKNTEELKTLPYKQTSVSEIKSDIYVQSYSKSNEEPDKISSTLQDTVSKNNIVSNVLSRENISDIAGDSEIQKIDLSQENAINIGHQSTDSSPPEDHSSLNMKELKKFIDKQLPISFLTSELCVESETGSHKSFEIKSLSSEDVSKNNIPSNVLQQETISETEIVSEGKPLISGDAILMESKCLENKPTSDGNVFEIIFRIPEVKITGAHDETDNSNIETKFDNVSGSSRPPAISVTESNISESTRAESCISDNTKDIPRLLQFQEHELDSSTLSIRPESSSLSQPSSSDISSESFYQFSHNETLLSKKTNTQINIEKFDFLSPIPANCELDDVLIETQSYLKGEQTLINKEIMETSSSPTSSSSETSSICS